MPEADSVSLPTAGTLPQTDDDSSPDLIKYPQPYYKIFKCSTVLQRKRNGSYDGLRHCFLGKRQSKDGFSW